MEAVAGMLLHSTALRPVRVHGMGQNFSQTTKHYIWINNRQNLHWSITSMSVLRCLWHRAQLHLERRDTLCLVCMDVPGLDVISSGIKLNISICSD